jgi:hypothetical protein
VLYANKNQGPKTDYTQKVKFNWCNITTDTKDFY